MRLRALSPLHLAPLALVVACGPGRVASLSAGAEATSGEGELTGEAEPPSPGDGDGDEVPTLPGDGDGDLPQPGDGDGDGDGDDLPPDPGDGDGDDIPPDPDPGDGDGDPVPGSGQPCTSDGECPTNQCYLLPFLGGYCGECNEDADCPGGGCTSPNPFENTGPVCNAGEVGGGCQSSEVCQPGLSCQNILDLLGLITLDTCSPCSSDFDCPGDQICTAQFDTMSWSGSKACIEPGSLPQGNSCELEGNGDLACASGHCSGADIMGLAELGACGECTVNSDCPPNQLCFNGVFNLDTAELSGASCQ